MNVASARTRHCTFLLPVLVLVAPACGGEAPCDETKTCVLDGDATVSGSTSSVGGSSTTTSAGGGAATGTGGSGAGGMGSGGDGPDTTPPTVLSVSPGVGEIGVASDDKLVITFSEPMDQAETEMAFASGDFGIDTMIWTDATTLEIVPTGLAYAVGGPSVVANSYAYQLKGTAKDLAGNALGSPFDGTFATLRKVTDNPAISESASVNSQGPSSDCYNQGGRFLGWRSTTFCRYLVSFDLAPIPNGADVQTANLTCRRYDVIGDPFAEFSSQFDLQHVEYPANNLALGANVAPTATIGAAFSSPSDVVLSLGVATAVKTALMQNDQEVQFRIRLVNEPMFAPAFSDHALHFASPQSSSSGCQADALTVTYLAP